MVMFDILVSHRRMSKWHEKKIQGYLRLQQAMQAERIELQLRIDSNAHASTSAPESFENGTHQPHNPAQRPAAAEDSSVSATDWQCLSQRQQMQSMHFANPRMSRQ